MAQIPPRQPIGDRFRGAVLFRGNDSFLCSRDSCVDSQVGDFVIRYGVRYLGKPFLSIVPGLLAVDYGTFLTCEEAWDFLFKRSNLYPRAEVFGYRNDGVDDQAFVRQLDVALMPETLVYADATATTPIARPHAFLGAHEDAPMRVQAYLPLFENLAAWQSENPDERSRPQS